MKRIGWPHGVVAYAIAVIPLVAAGFFHSHMYISYPLAILGVLLFIVIRIGAYHERD